VRIPIHEVVDRQDDDLTVREKAARAYGEDP
jgi:hypothetical protein